MKLFFFSILACSLFAQSDRPLVVQVQRPAAAPKLPSMDNLLSVQQLLGNDPARVHEPTAAPVPDAPAPVVSSVTKAPKEYKPRRDVPLDANSKKAVAISALYSSRPNPPTEGRDGTIVFTFGAGEPTIVCAPLRLCVLELEVGEKLTGAPQASDEVRWDVLPEFTGIGDEKRSLILLRPHDSGLEANLVITTERRIYYLRLVSKPTEYMARVTFDYQDKQNAVAWKSYQAELAAYEASRPAVELPKVAQKSADDFCRYEDSGYAFKGKADFRPLGACDDGTFTKFTLPDVVHTGGAPVFMVLGPKKGMMPANYEVKKTTYIVHQIFDRGVLVVGTGKKQKRIEIDSPRGALDGR